MSIADAIKGLFGNAEPSNCCTFLQMMFFGLCVVAFLVLIYLIFGKASEMDSR